MNNQSLWYLENIDVTGIFCPDKMDAHEDTVNHKKFKKGEYIYMAEEMADRIFFLFEGRVKIGSYNKSGKEITKAILTKGEIFGELALMGREQRRDFAIAMDDTECCVIPSTQMSTLIRDHNGLSLFLMRIMGSRMLEMEQRLESLVFKDSRTRIVEFLKTLADKKGQRVGYEMLVRQFLTHQEIANLTATSRQTVTTVLNDLRNKNILTFNRRRLLIRDMEALQKEMAV
jgi:CRP/FNR family cyclic AMP-dependent transcriptional regulator